MEKIEWRLLETGRAVKVLSVLKWFAGFFVFGASMCALTLVLLLFPGTRLDSLWLINPDAHQAFHSLGNFAVLLMLTVGTGCAFAAIGLWRSRPWGLRVALIILSVNIAGDIFNALVRNDYRALVGLPIGGAMIFYLAWRLMTDTSSAG